jgi:hypothetical protein
MNETELSTRVEKEVLKQRIGAAIAQAEWALDVADTENKEAWFDAVIDDVRKIRAILKGEADGMV